MRTPKRWFKDWLGISAIEAVIFSPKPLESKLVDAKPEEIKENIVKGYEPKL